MKRINKSIYRTLIYHFHSNEIRNKKNKSLTKKNSLYLNLIGILFLFKQFLFFFFSKKNLANNIDFAIQTSPQNHVRRALSEFIENIVYLGKGKIHLYRKVNLNHENLLLAYKFSQKFERPFFEVLALVYEIKCFDDFFMNIKSSQTVYSSNFIDRYAFLLGEISKIKKFQIIVIPHGKLMKFNLKFKFRFNKIITPFSDDIDVVSDYAFFDEYELNNQIKTLNRLIPGAKGKVAYIGSASNQVLNYKFILSLTKVTNKTIVIYPHPRERKFVYKVICFFFNLEMCANKYYDFDIIFGRLSTLMYELNKLNKNVVFLNMENRSLNDFPESVNIISKISNIESFEKLL